MRNGRLPLLALTVLAACAELPTDSKAGPPNAGGPSYDGGLVFGSGNRTEGDSTQTATTTTSTTTSDSTDNSGDGDGGLVFGSGN